MRKVLIALFLVMIVSLGSGFAGGDGSASNPYQIETCQQLQDMTNDLDANYTLNNDIDCSDTVNWNGGQGFDPIGPFSFEGSLEGNGYEISDLYIKRDMSVIGMFGETSNAEIQNLHLTGINYTSNDSDNDQGGIEIGGISGQSQGSTYENLSVSGTINSISNMTDGTGGIIGDKDSGTPIIDSYTDVDISVALNSSDNAESGGLAGRGQGDTTGYSLGNVEGGTLVGGMIADVGFGVTINGYSATDTVTGQTVGGDLGESGFDNTLNTYWDEELSGVTTGQGTGLTTSQMTGASAQTNMGNLDFTNTWETVEASDSDATEDGYPILQDIDRERQLASQDILAESVSLVSPNDNQEFVFTTDNVTLTGDVSLNDATSTEVNWTVDGTVVNTETVSSSGQVSYVYTVTEGSSYTWSMQTDGTDSETRSFSIDEQSSGFYETSKNFSDNQVLVETYSQGDVNLTLNSQVYELSDGQNSIPVDNRNFSIRYDIVQTEQEPEPRVENLTFFSIKEEGIIEEYTVDMESGTVNEDLSAQFGEDPDYIDVLIEMEETADNQNDRPALNYYNLTYTADEEVRSIGFEEEDVGLILIALLVSSFAIAILRS